MILVFFIISFYLTVFSEERLPYDVTTVVVIGSDDDELNQALLLIDMLKTDYLKLLRQNYEVAKNGKNITAIVEQSTCAATNTVLENKKTGSTQNPTIATLSTTTTIVPHSAKRDPTPNKGDAAWQSWHASLVHAAPMVARWADLGTTRVYNYTMPLYDAPNPPRQPPGPVRLPLRPWRRFFPDPFFYVVSGVHPRRFPKSPFLNRRTYRPAPLATTRATATTERPTKSTENIKGTLTSSSKATSKSVRTSNGRTLRQQSSKKVTFRKKNSTYIEHTDPVEAEVAAELLNEFKLINITPKTKIRKTVTVGGTSTE